MTDEAWENINIDAGNVALDSSYAEEMELPKAQDFPWDRSKGIYYLNGYHNLHCLVGPSRPSSVIDSIMLTLLKRKRYGCRTIVFALAYPKTWTSAISCIALILFDKTYFAMLTMYHDTLDSSPRDPLAGGRSVNVEIGISWKSGRMRTPHAGAIFKIPLQTFILSNSTSSVHRNPLMPRQLRRSLVRTLGSKTVLSLSPEGLNG